MTSYGQIVVLSSKCDRDIDRTMVTENKIVIGRNPDCDILVNRPQVGDRHVEITIDKNHKAWLRPQDHHEVLLNGEPLTFPFQLHDRDLFTICGRSFRWEDAKRPNTSKTPKRALVPRSTSEQNLAPRNSNENGTPKKVNAPKIPNQSITPAPKKTQIPTQPLQAPKTEPRQNTQKANPAFKKAVSAGLAPSLKKTETPRQSLSRKSVSFTQEELALQTPVAQSNKENQPTEEVPMETPRGEPEPVEQPHTPQPSKRRRSFLITDDDEVIELNVVKTPKSAQKQAESVESELEPESPTMKYLDNSRRANGRSKSLGGPGVTIHTIMASENNFEAIGATPVRKNKKRNRRKSQGRLSDQASSPGPVFVPTSPPKFVPAEAQPEREPENRQEEQVVAESPVRPAKQDKPRGLKRSNSLTNLTQQQPRQHEQRIHALATPYKGRSKRQDRAARTEITLRQVPKSPARRPSRDLEDEEVDILNVTAEEVLINPADFIAVDVVKGVTGDSEDEDSTVVQVNEEEICGVRSPVKQAVVVERIYYPKVLNTPLKRDIQARKTSSTTFQQEAKRLATPVRREIHGFRFGQLGRTQRRVGNRYKRLVFEQEEPVEEAAPVSLPTPNIEQIEKRQQQLAEERRKMPTPMRDEIAAKKRLHTPKTKTVFAAEAAEHQVNLGHAQRVLFPENDSPSTPSRATIRPVAEEPVSRVEEKIELVHDTPAVQEEVRPEEEREKPRSARKKRTPKKSQRSPVKEAQEQPSPVVEVIQVEQAVAVEPAPAEAAPVEEQRSRSRRGKKAPKSKKNKAVEKVQQSPARQTEQAPVKVAEAESEAVVEPAPVRSVVESEVSATEEVVEKPKSSRRRGGRRSPKTKKNTKKVEPAKEESAPIQEAVAQEKADEVVVERVAEPEPVRVKEPAPVEEAKPAAKGRKPRGRAPTGRKTAAKVHHNSDAEDEAAVEVAPVAVVVKTPAPVAEEPIERPQARSARRKGAKGKPAKKVVEERVEEPVREAEPAPAPVQEAPKKSPSVSSEDLTEKFTKMTVVNLKSELKKRNLSIAGLKAELVKRLVESELQAEAPVVEAPVPSPPVERKAEEPKQSEPTLAKEAEEDGSAPSKSDDFESMLVVDLRKMLKSKGLSTAGKKSDLVKRLREAL